MRKIKKTLSVLLAVIMLLSAFSVVPFTANAAEITDYTGEAADQGSDTYLTVASESNLFAAVTKKYSDSVEYITVDYNLGLLDSYFLESILFQRKQR